MKNLITIDKLCGLAATNGNPAVDKTGLPISAQQR